MRAGDRHGETVEGAGGACVAQDREAIGVADVIAEGHDGVRPQVAEQPRERLALAAGRAGPQVDDEAAAVVGQLVRRQLGVDGLDRPLDRRSRGDPIVGLSDVEGDRRTLALDEQPGGTPEHLRHPARQGLGGFDRASVVAAERGGESGRVAAARERPRLEAVVAEVDDATDADPGRHVERGPAGQDGHGGTVGMAGRDTGDPAQGATGERHDGRGTRVTRPLRERAVEVGHDQEAARPLRETGDRGDRRWPPVRGA